MKRILIAAILLVFIGCKQKKWYPETDGVNSMIVYSFQTHVPIDEYNRKYFGYDSIQLIIRNGKLEANFCYPNQWEFEKFRKEGTFIIHDTIYIDNIKNHK